jgi:hypothetical protein
MMAADNANRVVNVRLLRPTFVAAGFGRVGDVVPMSSPDARACVAAQKGVIVEPEARAESEDAVDAAVQAPVKSKPAAQHKEQSK